MNKHINVIMTILLLLPAASGCDKIRPFIDDEAFDKRMDFDNDGIPRPMDCDDRNPKIGILSWHKDIDTDGIGGGVQIISCFMPENATSTSGDCDDTRKNVFPGAKEICDGIDNDCNGKTDEGLSTPWYEDSDHDTFGNPKVMKSDCKQPDNYVANNTDCNDKSFAVKPGASEICNSVDDDCNGQTDEDLDQTWYEDSDTDGVGGNVKIIACSMPLNATSTTGDCDDTKKEVFPGAKELCDGIDNDCNGKTDEGIFQDWYEDFDNDTYGNAEVSKSDCKKPVGYVSDNTDCNDKSSAVKPNAKEICNSVDDDCNGQTDEGLDQTWYEDSDTDGFGSDKKTVSCTMPSDATLTTGDCDDTKKEVFPGAQEACDGIDNDCNGQTDEGLAKTWHEDFDKDTFGNPEVSKIDCKQPNGYVANKLDCDDKSSDVKPNAKEICNSVDDDCNGQTDEGLTTAWYVDSDNDTYGDAKNKAMLCGKKDGYVANQLDCNDNDKNVHPGKTEICDDNIDQNCNGIVDDATEATLVYPDSDNDGYGSPLTQKYACTLPKGFASNYQDCDDKNSKVNPSAKEICKDSIDNDCNGTTDTDSKDVPWYKDFDKDGYGNMSIAITACAPPTGYVDDGTDCDDLTSGINPGVLEICENGIDDNCDKSVNQCKLSGTIDPPVKIYGNEAQQWFGRSVAFTKDVSGDGIDDLIVGSSGEGSSTTPAGAVYIFFGPFKKGTSSLAQADVTITGETPGDRAGTSVAEVGDVNGDGNNDILIGAPFAPGSTKFSGAAYIFFGPFKKGTYELAQSDVKFLGEASNDQAGNVVFGAGDVNGDKNNDIMISAPKAKGVVDQAGVVYVMFGPFKKGFYSLSQADVKILGEAKNDYVGKSLASFETKNTNNILIGSTNWSTGNKGAASVFNGPILKGTYSIKQADSTFVGDSTNSFAGISVASAGDVNKDSHTDIVIGANTSKESGPYSGTAYVVLGPLKKGIQSLKDADHKFVGNNSESAGSSVSSVDLNMDGYSDIVVGAESNSDIAVGGGAVYAIYGPFTKPIMQLKTESNIQLKGSSLNESLGSSISCGGIVSGNGFPSIVFGTPRISSVAKDSGGIKLLLNPGY